MNFIFESENGKLDVSNLKKLINPDGSESDDYLTGMELVYQLYQDKGLMLI